MVSFTFLMTKQVDDIGPAIEARGLTKRFGKTTAVRDLSFAVGWGRVTGFLGPNGAGKTTTLRMLLGLIRPTAGSSSIGGVRYGLLPRPASIVGAALDNGEVHPRRSALDHLLISAAIAGVDRRRIDEVLQLVELGAARGKHVGDFSLGMRQRLALASALLGGARILLLDEPGNGLDPQGLHWLRGFLRDFAGRGNSVFVSSHLLAEMALMADDVVVIDRGALVAHAPVADLLAEGERKVRVRSPERDRLRRALEAEGATVEAPGEDTLIASPATTEHVGSIAAAEGIVLFGLEAERPSLEDVFLGMTRHVEAEG